MIDLETLEVLANVAEVLGMVSIVFGLVFAVIQVRQFRKQRREIATLELFKSWQTPEFAAGLRAIIDLPQGMDPEDLSTEVEDLAFIVGMYFESAGVMAYRGIVSLQLVDDLMGGSIRVTWYRLEPWVGKWRERNPRAYEWFEWLVRKLEDQSPLSEEYVAYKRDPKINSRID